MGKGIFFYQNEVIRCAEGDSVEDIKFLEGDVKKFMVKGISIIEFSNRIQQILFKEMETTVMLKLLGCNIGYAALYNQIISLWRPPKSFHLMDIENEYFLAKRILEVVRGLVGKVAKVDFNMDSKIKMVKFLDLDRPLVFQVWVNGELQWVEYEALPTICFSCGKCGHLKEMYPSPVAESKNVIGKVNGDSGPIE
ncbi:hypothetical protein Godav_023429 [Gossypium davidsonii]|uniref:CCHC-type domain-containing protein n=1 Tax=Gossypium davidsonii TaxID=34287 RepID=A0A7J8SRT0_GOSDV|nr:hypothetical protein [Gossypium davidsonii]